MAISGSWNDKKKENERKQAVKIKKLIYRTRFLPIAYIIMLLVIFILPNFSFPEYTITKNTLSHLGSQFAPNAVYMNTVFFLLGIASVIDGWRILRAFWFHKVVLLVFGLSLIACTFFQHAPIISEMPYNAKEDELHSLFATLTGVSFVVFAIASGFIVKGWFQRSLAFLIGIIATLLSILMFEAEAFIGIWQRTIFIMSFGWLLFIFNRRRVFT